MKHPTQNPIAAIDTCPVLDAHGAWFEMMSRSGWPNGTPDRPSYGLGVHPRWRSFDLFLLGMGTPPSGHVLERVDPTVCFQSGNCRWVTPEERERHLAEQKPTEVAYEGVPLNVRQADALLGLTETSVVEFGRLWNESLSGAFARLVEGARLTGDRNGFDGNLLLAYRQNAILCGWLMPAIGPPPRTWARPSLVFDSRRTEA